LLSRVSEAESVMVTRRVSEERLAEEGWAGSEQLEEGGSLGWLAEVVPMKRIELWLSCLVWCMLLLC
jgi:hypothetical protein